MCRSVSPSFDVFLSHSSKDKPIVRPLAERLRKDGVRVWFDEWEIKPGDSIPAKIEEGLEHSRVLVLCMSTNAFGSDWAQLESGTFRFRDPLNQERHFILLRLDESPIVTSLAHFSYINWRPENRPQEYSKLLAACCSQAKPLAEDRVPIPMQDPGKTVRLDYDATPQAYAFSADGKKVLCGDHDGKIRLWDATTGDCLHTLKGHRDSVWSVAWSANKRFALSGGMDRTVRLWNVRTERCLRTFTGHRGFVLSVSLGSDSRFAASGAHDKTVRVWDANSGLCIRVLEGHEDAIYSVALSADGRLLISGSEDNTVRLWDLKKGRCLRVLEGHTGGINSLAWSADGLRVISGGDDKTLRLWDINSGRCVRVFKAHMGAIQSVAWSTDQQRVLSGAGDGTTNIWDLSTGRLTRILQVKGDRTDVRTVVWSTDGRRVLSGNGVGSLYTWDVSDLLLDTSIPASPQLPVPHAPEQIQYTNAKVLLVGETGAGKTGLSKRLALKKWEASDSTVGAWATQWKLPVASNAGVEREIWLWDFGGQADQRLIHQLYMDETALAVLVFDGQKEDIFETLGQWDRDLTRASRKEFIKLLVAGRVDTGGLRVSRSEIERFAKERNFRGFLETSSKQNHGCDELEQAIFANINWDEIPSRTTEILFKRLKEEIIRLKDEGRVMMRFNELRESLQLHLAGEFKRFADEELRAALALLAGPGVVWELAFGSWVLLQPERINAYAQAVIRTLQADDKQRGCLMEERVLKGDLMYESSVGRLQGDEERFVLLAMHQTLVERGLCLRQPTPKGNLLVFPSYYRRERSDIVKFPAVLVNYRFTGFLDELYATLVVRLHHSETFQQDELWRYAADFKTNAGKQLGIKLTRRAPGVGDLEVYFDPAVAIEEKIIFSKYVHEHLLQHARDVERLRHYVCPKCDTPVGNRDVAMKRLNEWLRGRPPQGETTGAFKLRKKKEETPSIICVGCEQRVPLWDEMEQCFASPEIQQRVRDMQEESAVELSNQSKERALVGEVISTVALADQISREFNVSDHGIDMEIEFTDDDHEATNRKIYLQLKSGDSYTRKRKSDGVEIFTIKDERHARYWTASAFPVLLVIRNSEGEVRWMEVRDWLKRESDNGKKAVKQIVFEGERFDVMSVRRWRESVLGG